MVKKRLVACLLWRQGGIVQSVGFSHNNVIASATTAVDFFNIWSIDEVVLLDVSRDSASREQFYETIQKLSRRCFVPLTVGGRVTFTDEIRHLLQLGADKVVINTAAVRDPDLVERGAQSFGSQCFVVSMDAKVEGDGAHEVYVDRGREATGLQADEWAAEAERLGADEIFLTSIDRDGSKEGYDAELVRSVTEAVSIPVVASGGVGEWEHLVEGVEAGGAEAVSVANRFHHNQQSTKEAKQCLREAGVDVRNPYFYEVDMPRDPSYEVP